MKTLTATTLANLPGVNLLPPEIHERQRLQQVQLGLGVAVLAAVGGVALLYMSGAGQRDNCARQVSRQRRPNRQRSTAKSPRSSSSAKLNQQSTHLRPPRRRRRAPRSIGLTTWPTSPRIMPPGSGFRRCLSRSRCRPGSLATPGRRSGLGRLGSDHRFRDRAGWLLQRAQRRSRMARRRGQGEGLCEPVVRAVSREPSLAPTKVAAFTSSMTLTSDALTKRCAQPGVC